jgi:hypothetical protein
VGTETGMLNSKSRLKILNGLGTGCGINSNTMRRFPISQNLGSKTKILEL